MIQEYSLKVSRTARVFTLGKLNSETKYVWLVCHGYGQLAYYFIQKFKLPTDHYIVAPEALSRFYMEDKYEKVGASWMTKEDRLHEIEDYLSYLDSVYEQYIIDGLNENIQVVALGFSQGCSTISRWAANTCYRIDKLVMVGGVPAQELWENGSLKKYKAIINLGKEDTFFKGRNYDEIIEKTKIMFCELQPVIHDGGHILDERILKSILPYL